MDKNSLKCSSNVSCETDEDMKLNSKGVKAVFKSLRKLLPSVFLVLQNEYLLKALVGLLLFIFFIAQ